MKIQHSFKVNPDPENPFCAQCDSPRRMHRGPRPGRVRHRPEHDRRVRAVGVDGEGQTTDGFHRYVYMAAVRENGDVLGELKTEKKHGLSTEECLDFLIEIQNRYRRLFAYSFGYDLTKILTDVDDLSLYRLFRPNLRKRTVRRKNGTPTTTFVSVYWGPYKMNWLQGRFSVKKLWVAPDDRIWESPTAVVHDIWKFFQGKFTTALEDWKVGTREELERMREMKDLRSEFDRLDPEEVRRYCLKECEFMAKLAVKLKAAHDDAGIPLKTWYGAGSTAGSLLAEMGIRKHLDGWRAREDKERAMPERMRAAVASAFFGGRFENARIGAVEGKVHSWDISSAYPYQSCFLPCLEHAGWTLVRGSKAREAAFRAPHALVRYRLRAEDCGRGTGKWSGRKESWAPFPFRLDDGSICYPSESEGGWLWREEFFAGARVFAGAECLEAWIYEADCDCQPFATLPEFYRERVRIGKEGPGIVLKLGCNSVYGKLAQSAGGGGVFTSWVWAGMITSGTRAQILEVMGLHQDLGNLLMVATDGIATLEELEMPGPKESGTGGRLECPVSDETPEGWCEKPLGGWEYKLLEKGLFLARPGIYFPLKPTRKELKKVRARGVGRGTVFEQWEHICGEFEKAKEAGTIAETVVRVQNLSRFLGAKTSITRSGQGPKFKYRRSPRYGQWIVRPVDMTFDPLPKREGIEREEGRGGCRLGVRSMAGRVSAPYDPAVLSPEAIMLKELTDEAYEQPDGGDLAFGEW